MVDNSMEIIIDEYINKFGELPQLPKMVVYSDIIVLRLMKEAIKNNKELSFEDIADAMNNKYDIVRS